MISFRTIDTETPTGAYCWCDAPLLGRLYNDGARLVVCKASPAHDGSVCAAVGHPEAWSSTKRCDLCNRPVQWVRAEVAEGKAYTYAAFEEPRLSKGEMVILPGNSVQANPFVGKVIRLLHPEDVHNGGYAGPFKAVVRRDLL